MGKFIMRELTTPIRSNIRFRKSPVLREVARPAIPFGQASFLAMTRELRGVTM